MKKIILCHIPVFTEGKMWIWLFPRFISYLWSDISVKANGEEVCKFRVVCLIFTEKLLVGLLWFCSTRMFGLLEHSPSSSCHVCAEICFLTVLKVMAACAGHSQLLLVFFWQGHCLPWNAKGPLILISDGYE